MLIQASRAGRTSYIFSSLNVALRWRRSVVVSALA